MLCEICQGVKNIFDSLMCTEMFVTGGVPFESHAWFTLEVDPKEGEKDGKDSSLSVNEGRAGNWWSIVKIVQNWD